jgi:hypothetical protein
MAVGCFTKKWGRIMRILLCSAAAIALSGCSWMGMGHGHKHQSDNSYHGGHYAQQSNANECCFGTKKLSRWNIEAGVGPEFIVGGDAVTGDRTHAGFTAPVTALNTVSMDTAYDTGYRADIGGSYAFTPNRKLTGQVYYSQADGKDVALGLQDDVELRGQMSDYKSYGVEAGLRQYFRPAPMPLVHSVRPYVEGKVGAAHIDSIRLENIRGVTPVDPLTPTTLSMYDDGWVPTGAALVGVETPLFNRMTVGVETGVRYAGKPKSDNSDFADPTSFNGRYSGLNNGGDRWTVPLTIRGRYRF